MKNHFTILFISILLFSVPVSASDTPGQLMGHKMVMVDGEIYLFGGTNSTTYVSWTDYLQDGFIRYDGEWTQLDSGPSQRYDHSMVLVGETIYVFGGAVVEGRANDLWKYDGEWMQIQCELSPPVRSSNGMVYDDLNNRLVIFGGYGEDDTKYDDTWAFYLENNSWVQIHTDNQPSKRYGHSMVYDVLDNVAIIFGGNDYPSGKKNDLWEFDMETDSWEEIEIDNPAPRYWHLAAYNEQDHEMLIFGGDVYLGTSSKIMSDTWKFDYSTKSWENITMAGPHARSLGDMVYDGESYIMYSGFDGDNLLGDMWILQDNIWKTMDQNTTVEETHLNSVSVIFGFVAIIFLWRYRFK